MKQKHIFRRLLSLVTVLCIVAVVGALTAYAEPEEVANNNEAQAQVDSVPDGMPQYTPENIPQDVNVEVPETQEPATEKQYEPIYEYIYGEADDAYSTYEEPEHLNDLPEVSSGELEIPKAVVIPDVEVSDASIFSGIVMWLCVALGIAVIVGVLVSKRTLRRGM